MLRSLFLTLILASAGVMPALAQRDFLTADEVDQLREAQAPDDRLNMYALFARQRVDLLGQLFEKEKNGRSLLIHDTLDQYTKIIEAIDTVVDDCARPQTAGDGTSAKSRKWSGSCSTSWRSSRDPGRRLRTLPFQSRPGHRHHQGQRRHIGSRSDRAHPRGRSEREEDRERARGDERAREEGPEAAGRGGRRSRRLRRRKRRCSRRARRWTRGPSRSTPPSRTRRSSSATDLLVGAS